MSELNDVLNQIVEEQERSNVIETIEFRSNFVGGAKQQYMEALDNFILEGISTLNNESDNNSHPLYQIAEQMKMKNIIQAIEFRSKFAGSAKQQYMEALDSMIDKYISKNMGTDTKSSMHWGGHKM